MTRLVHRFMVSRLTEEGSQTRDETEEEELTEPWNCVALWVTNDEWVHA
jgi:hypothetical protein